MAFHVHAYGSYVDLFGQAPRMIAKCRELSLPAIIYLFISYSESGFDAELRHTLIPSIRFKQTEDGQKTSKRWLRGGGGTTQVLHPQEGGKVSFFPLTILASHRRQREDGGFINAGAFRVEKNPTYINEDWWQIESKNLRQQEGTSGQSKCMSLFYI